MGSGSVHPPRLIELSYQPAQDGAGPADRHVVLIGKGITFDSGGLSLKPNDGMKLMKTDMAGGAAVIGAMSALARLGVRTRVTGLVAAAENMPSGTAMRVGDVITHYGGQTVEVLNTDAEGRLVLADALAYADDMLDPDLVVDLATLTGAARVALGTSIAALFATDDELATALLDAGTASGDRLWRMPLASDYRSGLDSPVADLANVARAGGRAGSIDAALFLREFTGRPLLGPSGHRRRGPGRVRRRREHQGRHRLRHPAAAALAGRLTPLDRGQQPVTDREQHGHQPVVLPHLLAQVPDGDRGGSFRPGSATRPPASALSNATTPPGRSSRSASTR